MHGNSNIYTKIKFRNVEIYWPDFKISWLFLKFWTLSLSSILFQKSQGRTVSRRGAMTVLYTELRRLYSELKYIGILTF